MDISMDKISKLRTNATANAILDNLKGVSVDKVITELFIYSEDEISTQLIKRFEAILISALTNPVKFKENLHSKYKEVTSFIKENNLYSDFFEFSYLIYSSFHQKDMSKDILFAYQNLIIQQYDYFCNPGEIVYGVLSDGELLIKDEPFPKIDYPFYKMKNNKNFSLEKLLNEFKKIGYNFNDIKDYEIMLSNDQTITNMTYVMSYFINDQTIDISPNKYILPSFGINTLRIWKETDFYLKRLKERNYLLPPNGVIGIYKNSGDISEILFKELFIDDRMFLLYKISNSKGESISGFFDTKIQFFYSIFKDTSGEIEYHSFIENFILENYCHLTTIVEIDRKRNFALKVVEDIEDEDLFLFENQPAVQYSYEHNIKDGSSGGKRLSLYSKDKYRQVNISINPYIRKLPMGASASEEAIAFAKEMGYALSSDETFVRPFKRKSYQLK